MQHTVTPPCNARQLSTAFERVNQTYSTAIGTHGSARHFDLTFIDQGTLKQWWRSMCASLAGKATLLTGAITCSNIVGEVWRNPMLTPNAIFHAKWEFFKLSRSQRI